MNTTTKSTNLKDANIEYIDTSPKMIHKWLISV